jgi:hypothetical protein
MTQSERQLSQLFIAVRLRYGPPKTNKDHQEEPC